MKKLFLFVSALALLGPQSHSAFASGRRVIPTEDLASSSTQSVPSARSDAERFNLLMDLRRKDPNFGPNTPCREAMELCREDWAYTVQYNTEHRGWDLSEDLKGFLPWFLSKVSGSEKQATFHQYAFVNAFFVKILDWAEVGEELNNKLRTSYYKWAEELSDGFDYDQRDFRRAFMGNPDHVGTQFAMTRLLPEMKALGFIMPLYGPQGEGNVPAMLDGLGTLDPHGGVLQMNVRATGFDSGSLEYDQYVNKTSEEASRHDFDHDTSQNRMSSKALASAFQYAQLKDKLYQEYTEGTVERALVQLYLWNVFHESVIPVMDLSDLMEPSSEQPKRPSPFTIAVIGNSSTLVSVEHNIALVESLGLEVQEVPFEQAPELVWMNGQAERQEEIKEALSLARKKVFMSRLHQQGRELVAPFVDHYMISDDKWDELT